MPKSEHFVSSLVELEAEYKRLFPRTMFPGTFLASTHVSPTGRPKKMAIIFPKEFRSTYSGIPAIVLTLRRDRRAPKRRVHIHLTNLITDHVDILSLSVSDDDKNHKALDAVLGLLRKHLHELGSIKADDIDHYSE